MPDFPIENKPLVIEKDYTFDTRIFNQVTETLNRLQRISAEIGIMQAICISMNTALRLKIYHKDRF